MSPGADDGTVGASENDGLWRCLLLGVRGLLTVGILAGCGSMWLAALIPWWIGGSIEYLTLGRVTVAGLGLRCLVLAFLVGLTALLTMVQERCDTLVRVSASMRAMTWVHRHGVSLSDSAQRSSAGVVVSLGLGDIHPVGAGVASLTRGIAGLTAVLAVGLILFTYSWQLCAVVLVGVVLLLRVNDWLLKPYRASQQVVRDRMGDLTGVALDASSGLRVIKGLGAADRFSARYRTASRSVLSAATVMARSAGAMAGYQAFAAGLLAAGTVWLAVTTVRSGSLSIGGLVTAYGYAVFLATPMRWLLGAYQQWATARISAGRISAYLDLRPVCDERAVTFDGTVSDPDAGWCAAAGEYTVVASAEPTDWMDVADRLLERYREPSRVRVIRADDYLFSGPLAEVLDPRGEATSSTIAEAIHAAVLADVIDALPEGIDHEVAAGGVDLSGGEQQRVRLARALIAATAALVLADPTTALDSTTEVEVAKRLHERRAGATTVVLTNSPPHLIEADRVIVLRCGGVLATGTHRELMEQPGYRAMVARGGMLA